MFFFYERETSGNFYLLQNYYYSIITKLNTTAIYHNAGITGDYSNGYPAFYKGKYHQGNNPFKDDEHMMEILNNETSKKHCTYFYLTELIELQNKYKLNY